MQAQQQAVQSDSVPEPPQTTAATLELNTTSGSFLHRWVTSGRMDRSPSVGKAYFVAVAITYLPLIVCALMSPLPVAARTATLRLPFLYDWNLAFMFLVTFPSLVILTVTDQYVLASSLRRVQLDGVVSIPEAAARSLSSLWRRRFRSINIGAQLVGVGFGLLLTFLNYKAYTPEPVGYWIAIHNRLSLPVGLAFLYCIFLFYSLIPITAVQDGTDL